MNTKIAFAFLASCILFNSNAFAQMSCEMVYATSIRNVDIDIRSLAEQNDVYSTHCESNGSIRESSKSLDLTVPIKKVKLGFSGSQSDAQHEMQEFCKAYQQNYNKSEAVYKASSIVVSDALRSYNQCKALEINKVQISHVATESRSVAISVNFNPAVTKLELYGVNYDTEVATCRSDISKETEGKIDASIGSIRAKEPFSVACDRTGSLTTDGSKKYSRFEIIVNTSAGAYAFAMPVEEVLGYDLASQNKTAIEAASAKIIELNNEKLSLQAKIDNITSRMNGISITPHIITQGEGAPIPCPQDGGNLEKHTTNICGNAKRTSLIKIGGHSGGRCGYGTYKFACYSYP